MKKLATLEPDAMNAALGAGAPWYTSGAQKWNGAAATLKPRPMAVVTMAMHQQRVEGWTVNGAGDGG